MGVILLFASFLTVFAQSPQSPQPVTPANNVADITPNNIQFEWNASGGALYYHIQIARNPNFTGLLDADQTRIVGTNYVFFASIVNNPPEAAADYYWRVAAVNDYGQSSWSPVQQFRTGYPDGQAVLMRFFNADSSLALVALNSRDYYDTRLLYSKTKTLRRDTTVLYRQEDFPYLYAEPFTTRRIDFLRANGAGVYGHLQFDYRFSDVPPFGPRTDLLLYFHPKRIIPKSRYPKWNYYGANEIPVTALIPPGGQTKLIDTSKIPVLLIHGAGYTSWGNVPSELRESGYDVWQWLYPAESPIDSSAALLADAMKRLASIYGTKKIGLAAHGTGGLVVRAYIQGPLNGGNAGKLLMLGTPNHGSYFAYKLAYTEEFTATASEYVRRLDRNAPLWQDAAPGSEILARINSSPFPSLTPSGYDLAASYLCVAGLTDMPLDWPHNEITGYDDGVAAMQSVSLFDKFLPLATTQMTAVPSGTGKNLLENSSVIIAEFMRENYSPRSPAQKMLDAVTSFAVLPSYIIKPDNYLYGSPSIEIWNVPTLNAPRLSVVRDKNIPNITLFPESDVLETESRYGMTRNPSSERYFSVSRTGDGGIGWDFINQNHAVRFADYIHYPVDKQATTRRRRAIPVSVEPTVLRLYPMQTVERTVKFKNPIAGAWLTGGERRHEMYVFSETERASVRDTIPFRIDPYMDTMLVIAMPLDNTQPLQSAAAASFNLIAPNGMSFDEAKGDASTVPQYSGGGTERFAADGAAYFFMARPMAGIWNIACNTAVQPLRFAVSFLSDLSLRITTEDSVFSTGDSVKFDVVLPNFFFSDLKVTASLYYDANPDSSRLGIPLDLERDQFNPAIYHGSFVPKSNGMYYIRADFSAQFPEARIARSTFRSVEVADALPERPELVFPPRLAADVPRNTRLVWKSDLRARSYRVQLAQDFRFDTLLVDMPYTSDTILTLPELAATTVYYWRVQAKNARGTTEWSSIFWFSTGGKALGITPLVSPINGSVVIRRDTAFKWGAVIGAPLYQVQISKDSLFYASSLDTLVFGTQVKFSLENSSRYFWRVRALTGTGQMGIWSEVWRIRRLVPSPLLYLPADKAENLPTDITFSWAPPLAGLKYRLQVSYRPDFQTLLLDVRDIGDTAYAVTLPKSGEIYFWRVRWALSDGESDWSPARSFATTVAVPRQDSPGNGITGVNLNPTISWNSVPNAIYYHLQLSSEPDFISPVFNDSTLPTVSRAMKTLEPLTRYFWRVRAFATAGKSPWSDIWEFVTGENPDGITEAYVNYTVRVVPNPNSGKFKLELPPEIVIQAPDDIRIEIVNALGIMVRRERLEIAPQTGAIYLSIEDMPPGSYRMRIFAGNTIMTTGFTLSR